MARLYVKNYEGSNIHPKPFNTSFFVRQSDIAEDHKSIEEEKLSMVQKVKIYHKKPMVKVTS
jgi:hypothetical protein